MKYLGQMRTAYLNDRQLRPTEYTRWADARRRFATRDKDRAKVEELKASIARQGLQEPLVIGISDRHPDDVYVGDGHHRAVVLMDLGIPRFPFHWYWIRDFGVRMESGPFPFHVLTDR